MVKETNFIANVKLKDIIGRGLIDDPNLAIIELIKNSKDAGSEVVYVTLYDSDDINKPNAYIKIEDFGKGMTQEEIESNWLNIAYSSKNKQKKAGVTQLAGSKGIGRFSCDSLGKFLELYSRSSETLEFSALSINWTKFEIDDQNAEISSIPLTISNNEEICEFILDGVNNKSGTTLIIRSLRKQWGDTEVKSLIKALEKFSIDPNNKFKIFLTIKKSSETLSNKPQKIENKIFKDLDTKTTSIKFNIRNTLGDEKKSLLFTELRHGGEWIFRTVEENIYPNLKVNLRANIFYLNRSAKMSFAKKTNYTVREYGSIFLFVNGFRIPPYGDPDDDWLKIEHRYVQGIRRFLSTRNLVGHISINCADEIFTPITNRAGIYKNDSYRQLTEIEECIIDENNHSHYGLFWKSLRKLEKFVVEGIHWDNNNEESEDLISSVYSIIGNQSKDFLKIQINHNHLINLANKQRDAYKDLIQELKDKDITFNNASNFDIQKFSKALELQQVIIKRTEQSLGRIMQEKELIDAENLFLRASSSQDTEALEHLHHEILSEVGNINDAISYFKRTLNKINIPTELDEKIKYFIGNIETSNARINQYSSFATTGNYLLAANKINCDFTSFISNYLQRLNDLKVHHGITIHDRLDKTIKHEISLKPLELTISIENIISNAKKAGAKNIFFENDKSIWLRIHNDGNELNERFIKNPEEIFLKGKTTTNGSGLGLYYVKKAIIDDMKLKINCTNTLPFTLEISE